MKLFKKAKKGFTLVELIVVIAIIAVLAAVSIIGYTAFVQSAKKSNANTEGGEVKTVLTSFLADGNRHQVAVSTGAATAASKIYYVQYVSATGISFYNDATGTGTLDALNGYVLGSLYNFLAADTKVTLATSGTTAAPTANYYVVSATTAVAAATATGTPTAFLTAAASASGVFANFTYTNLTNNIASDSISLL